MTAYIINRYKSVQFIDSVERLTCLCRREILVVVVIVFVAEQYVYTVLAKLPVVGKQLVEGVAEQTPYALAEQTVI